MLLNDLKSGGVDLTVPPFVFRVKSNVRVVADGLSRLYSRAIQPANPLGFADFHIAVHTRWHGLKRVCQFSVDGYQPFTPLAFDEGFALLEWGMNWCVTGMAHSWIAIHAAVLEKAGRAVLLPAPPGSGKSTLCAALMFNGWRLLSDEMALLDPKTGLLTPSPRPVGLKNQSIELVRQLSPDAIMGPVALDTLKGTVAHLKVSDTSWAKAQVCVPPAWVVFPKYESGSPLVVNAKAKSTSLVELASNSFNQHVHGRQGFDALVALVDGADCFELRYGEIANALAWFNALDVRV